MRSYMHIDELHAHAIHQSVAVIDKLMIQDHPLICAKLLPVGTE